MSVGERLRAAKDRVIKRRAPSDATKAERAQWKAEAEARRMELKRKGGGGPSQY